MSPSPADVGIMELKCATPAAAPSQVPECSYILVVCVTSYMIHVVPSCSSLVINTTNINRV